MTLAPFFLTMALAVHLKFTGEGFPLNIEVYELKDGSALANWTTGSTAKKKDLPVGSALKNATFTLEPGKKKRLVLVAKNDTKKDVYFFASPHSVTPAKDSLGLDFRCMCLNHAYHAPAGESWYRVIELRAAADLAGKEVDITHELVTVSKERAAENQVKGAVVAPPP